PFFINVCKFLGIDEFIAVFDSDLHEGKNIEQIKSANTSTENIHKAVEGDLGKCVVLNPDFENLCGYTSTDSNKIKNAISWVNGIQKQNIPTKFTSIVDFLKSSEAEVELKK
ncbi:MAG: hypothetical protein ABL940_11595, partial [Bacteroidia bacterium]